MTGTFYNGDMKKGLLLAKVGCAARQLSLTRAARLILAFYLLMMLLGQLFTFERFPTLLRGIGFGEWSALIAALLVALELLAMPWLIELQMERRLRTLSAVSAALSLSVLSLLELAAHCQGSTILFGASLHFPPGVWSLLKLAALWILLLYVASGVLMGAGGGRVKARHSRGARAKK